MTQHPSSAPSAGGALRVLSLVVAVVAGAVFLVLLVASSTGLWHAALPVQAFITGGAFLLAAGGLLLHLDLGRRTPRR